jgi:hypothetical protein
MVVGGPERLGRIATAEENREEEEQKLHKLQRKSVVVEG